MGVAGQSVADEHGVRTVGIELPPRLIGQGDLLEPAPRLQSERATVGDRHETPLPHRIAGTPGTGGHKVGREPLSGVVTQWAVVGVIHC